MRIAIKPGQYGWSFEELEASWNAAEDAGFDAVSCFDHVTASPRGLRAWDASSLLVAMAGRTERIGLSVRVFNSALRNPLLLASQLAVAQAASGGRLNVGLGAGSGLARFDHVAMGVPFPSFGDRVERLERVCRVLPALWRGETVDETVLGLRAASLGDLDIQLPPVVVGGGSEAVLDVAVRAADGWDGPGEDLARYERLAERVVRRTEEIGRERPLQREATVFLADVGVDGLRSHLGSLGEAGAEAVTVVLHTERGPDWVRRVADAVLH
jgi:alkanesulfonate monooxygenase SsuD/methylene tetrahydromethanopterin reductase-like flavin-dependent oxidoreductase (luciferase family)